MKIGIMGGTFNPPHKGHKNIIIESKKALDLDKIYVIPNNIPVHKKLPEGSPSPEKRLKMCEIMCKDLDFCKVLDIEIKKGGQSFTIDTLRDLENVGELFLIIGSDSFLGIEEWKEYDEVLKRANLVVFKRQHGIDLLEHKNYIEQKYNIKVYLIDAEILEISSTEIRQGKINKYAIKEVLEYIND